MGDQKIIGVSARHCKAHLAIYRYCINRHQYYFAHFFIIIKKGFWAFGVNKISSHLGYRWYQAPEISMIERYDQAVDMWSLGCVPSEELSMLQNFAK